MHGTPSRSRSLRLPLLALALMLVALAAPALAAAEPAPTILTMTAPPRVDYNTPAQFKGALTLDDVAVTPVPGHPVAFQSSVDRVNWRFIQDVQSVDNPLYTVQYLVFFTPIRATWFRFSFAGDGDYAPSVSTPVLVKPGVYLSTPAAPKVVQDKKKFNVYGYLKPRHASGAVYVKIRCYRRSSSGAWVLKKIVWARDADYRTYTTYRARFSLPSAGKWRLQAKYAGTRKYATTWSEYRSVTAK